MSDFRAIAASTLTLRNMLTDALVKANDIVPGARVETQMPKRRDLPDIDRGVVNIYLYQTTPNPSWRNADLPSRRTDGSLIHAPTLALDLHYLISFYGDDEALVPQILLGLTTSTLNTMPFPPPRFLPRGGSGDPNTLRDPLEEKLSGTGLMEQIELLRYSPLSMSHDELSRLWTIFFQIPYTLSVAYLCSVVLIQPDAPPPEPELPVTQPASVHFTLSYQLPQIEAVKPQVVDYDPRQTVVLEGQNLSATGLQVKIGGLDAPVVRASGSAAAVQLPAQTTAGMHSVVASRETEVGGIRRRLFGESMASLVVRPRIALPLIYTPGDVDTTPSVEAGVTPAVRPGQSARLMLNELRPPENRPPRAYTLSANEPSTGDQLSFRATGVDPGDYLARLEVAGVPSALSTDEDPASPEFGSFDGPILHVPAAGGGTT